MSQTPNDWKNKYFDSLAELEHKQKRWQSVESSLRRCISRLSFIGDGIDVHMDERLEQLRNRVRGEQDIKVLLQAIEDITRRSEKVGETKSRSSTVSAEALITQLISEAKLPKKLEKRAHKLARALKTPPVKPEVLESAKALLLEAMTGAVEQHGEEKSGLFGKLFVKDKVAVDSPEKEAVAVKEQQQSEQIEGQRLFVFLVNQLSRSMPDGGGLSSLVARADAAGNSWELEALAGELAGLLCDTGDASQPESLPSVDRVLLQLLEHLDLTPELQPRVQNLRARLNKGVIQADIEPILEELVQLVEHAKIQAEQERQEVERFLMQMTQQLQQLDQEVTSIGSTGHDLIEGGRKIEREMQHQMTDLQDTVDQSSDLTDLKLSITERLNLIQTRLKEHRGDTEQLVQDFEQRIDCLTNQLGDMEQEKANLHDSVSKARAEAFTDALTGLNNRHAFDCRLQEEFSRWSRYHNPLSMIMVDVDHFKKVNDTYGHLAGDKVLSVIGTHLKNATRQIDFCARYGGEEFVVLLPETDLDAAKSVAEKIRKAVAAKAFHSGSNRVNIMVSCGVAAFQKGDGRRSPFERADEALYLAKREGRNRCCTEEQVRLKGSC